MRLHGVARLRRCLSLPIKDLQQSRPTPTNPLRFSSTCLHPIRVHQLPLDRRWRGLRQNSGAAAAVYVYYLIKEIEANFHRLEQATEPEKLDQEAIIENLSPQEAARLSRIRNIGIAVSMELAIAKGLTLILPGPYRQWQDDGYGACSVLHGTN